MATILTNDFDHFEHIFNHLLTEGSTCSLKIIGPGVSEEVIQRCERTTDNNGQTTDDGRHNK